jgi:hypothetical protein
VQGPLFFAGFSAKLHVVYTPGRVSVFTYSGFFLPHNRPNLNAENASNFLGVPLKKFHRFIELKSRLLKKPSQTEKMPEFQQRDKKMW